MEIWSKSNSRSPMFDKDDGRLSGSNGVVKKEDWLNKDSARRTGLLETLLLFKVKQKAARVERYVSGYAESVESQNLEELREEKKELLQRRLKLIDSYNDLNRAAGVVLISKDGILSKILDCCDKLAELSFASEKKVYLLIENKIRAIEGNQELDMETIETMFSGKK